MVAARVRDGGGTEFRVCQKSAADPAFVFVGKSSDVYNKCLQEVQTISCATLFAPVLRVEAVQAMSMSFSFAEIVRRPRPNLI
jgi:hypothetical protein